MRERILDQVYGKSGPGTPGWNGHDIAITQLKNRIRKLMEDFQKNNCGDGGGPPISSEAKKWFKMPNPAPSDWKGKSEGTVPASRSILDWEYWQEATGLTGIALVLYLVVSEGSRIYPPRNLVPVL